MYLYYNAVGIISDTTYKTLIISEKSAGNCFKTTFIITHRSKRMICVLVINWRHLWTFWALSENVNIY